MHLISVFFVCVRVCEQLGLFPFAHVLSKCTLWLILQLDLVSVIQLPRACLTRNKTVLVELCLRFGGLCFEVVSKIQIIWYKLILSCFLK